MAFLFLYKNCASEQACLCLQMQMKCMAHLEAENREAEVQYRAVMSLLIIGKLMLTLILCLTTPDLKSFTIQSCQLTLSQTTNFRLFQSEIFCRRQS